ncbi:hypothetical protein FOE78_01320 [Microlunatus elymi]|uniref:Secreted protein n=1 Tax=Microlunatus elymi TaxID=2596828 RepID=A0A516PU56_9ACTN|nr:DUF6049 family protein [Microlunatus elymi]QDP94736.1 hypothetical protein FOE78_01320 [Microlunatus elymi]
MRDGRWAGSGRCVVRKNSATLLALLLAALLGIASAAVANPARADADSGADVSIALSRLSPSIAHSDSTVVFEGTVTNTSDQPLSRLQATIWRDLTPITTRSELDTVNSSAPTDPVGARMYSSDTPNAFQDLYTDAAPDLAPGQSKKFRISAKASDLFESTTPASGIYLVGVQVREDGVSTVGRTRTYLPVVSDQSSNGLQPGQSQIGTSTLVELTATPTMTRTGVFTDDRLADQLAPGGRLDALLSAAEKPNTSYVVDPNLIAELRSMRAGYQVVDEDGHKTAGTGQDLATDWLNRFTAMQASHDGFQLLYADADLTSLVHAGRLDIVEQGQQAAARVPETKDLPLLVTPAGGAADRPTLSAAKQLGARAILLADDNVGDLGPVVSADNSPTILSYDTEASTGPGPDPRDTEVQLRQAGLADSYIDSVSGEDPSTLGRLRLVRNADEAGSETAVQTAPWLTPRSVADLLNDPTTPLGNRLSYPDADGKDELTGRQLNKIDQLTGDLTTYQHLLARPGNLGVLIEQSGARAASSSWRNHRKAMSEFVEAQRRLLTSVTGTSLSLDDLIDGDAVRVESNPQITLTGSSATVPVTIVNTLDVPISVQLVASSANQSRLRLEDVGAADINSGKAIPPGCDTPAPDCKPSRVPVQVPAHADANGDLPVTLRLETRQGEDVGRPQTIRVNATQAGLVGWVIAVAAGIVLLGTVVLRIRQVARERGESEPDASDTEPDDSDTGPDDTGTEAETGRAEPEHSTDGLPRG